MASERDEPITCRAKCTNIRDSRYKISIISQQIKKKTRYARATMKSHSLINEERKMASSRFF